MSKLRRGILVAAAVVIAVGLATAVWWLPARREEAPGFLLQTTGASPHEDGPQSVALQEYRGRTLVLDFMGVTCTSCRVVEHEVLAPLWQEYGNRSDFAMLSIDAWAGAAGETEAELVAFQEDSGHPWPYAMDSDATLARYGGYAIPKVVVITPDGRVALDETGAIDAAQVRDAVRASLEGQPPQASLMPASLPALSLVAGLGTFVSPCSVGLVPAYLARVAAPGGRPVVSRLLQLAGGTVLAYAALGLLLWMAGPFLRPHLPAIGLVVVAGMALAGLLLIVRVDWGRLVPKAIQAKAANAGTTGFGVAYGVAAFGCSGPVFLPLLTAAFAASAWTGWASLLLYWAAFAALFLAAAFLVQVGSRSWLGIARRARTLQVASGVLMVAGAFYTAWFYARAYGVS
jgi:cytochrome c-type biogenesis protein